MTNIKTNPNVLELFVKHFPELVQDMRDCEHGHGTGLNPFHLEGSVWTHTMMVLNYAFRETDEAVLHLAALLHDVGKPASRTVMPNERVRFSGHEAVSYYIACDVLNHDAFSFISDTERCTVLSLVACHSDLYTRNIGKTPPTYERGFLTLLNQLVRYDSVGRITNTSNVDPVMNYREPPCAVRENTPNCVVLIGPSNSGKSTWLAQHGHGASVLSRDEIVVELGPGDTYNDAWRGVNQSDVDALLMSRFHDLTRAHETFYIDMTNLSRKSRRKWVRDSYVRAHYNCVAVVFSTGVQELQRRADAQRDVKNIPPDVVRGMCSRFVFPNLSEFASVTVV